MENALKTISLQLHRKASHLFKCKHKITGKILKNDIFTTGNELSFYSQHYLHQCLPHHPIISSLDRSLSRLTSVGGISVINSVSFFLLTKFLVHLLIFNNYFILVSIATGPPGMFLGDRRTQGNLAAQRVTRAQDQTGNPDDERQPHYRLHHSATLNFLLPGNAPDPNDGVRLSSTHKPKPSLTLTLA